jgi:hypothetical protein
VVGRAGGAVCQRAVSQALRALALTIIRNASLQARQLRRPALGGAREDAMAQLLALCGLLISVPVRGHVVSSA